MNTVSTTPTDPSNRTHADDATVTPPPARPLSRWYSSQPNPVRGVLDLASLQPEDRQCFTLLFPQHATVLDEIADTMGWINRLESDYPSEVLSDLWGATAHGYGLIDAAEQEADRLQAQAILSAQLLASLLTATGSVAA